MNPARERQWLRFGLLLDTLRCAEAKAGTSRTDLAAVFTSFLDDPETALTDLTRHHNEIIASL